MKQKKASGRLANLYPSMESKPPDTEPGGLMRTGSKPGVLNGMKYGLHNDSDTQRKSKVWKFARFLAVLKRTILTYTFTVFIYNIYDKKKKGDRLMRNGRPLQAASVYKTALGKIKQPKWFYDSKFMIRESIFEDRSAVDAMNVLTCKLLAGLAAATLRSHKYKEVIQLTDSALKCSIGSSDCPHGIWDFCSHRYEIGCRGWEGHRKFDLVRLHYCRDLSLHRLGDTVSAIEHMEKALNLDPGDGTVFAQLTLLKQQQQEIQEEARKKRLYKLNGPQKKLYVKQARRKTMKL